MSIPLVLKKWLTPKDNDIKLIWLIEAKGKPIGGKWVYN